MGLVFSAFSWSYALLQIPGGIFLDRFGTRAHLLHRGRLLVASAPALMGVVRSLNGAAPDPHRRRRLRGAVLSRQQPDPGDLVSAARAGARELRSIRSASTSASASSACRCSGSRSGSAGAACSSSSAASASCSACVWWAALSQSGRQPDRRTGRRSTTSRPGGGGEYKGAAGHVQVAPHRRAAAAPAGARRVARPVRRQLDAGVLRHLVSDLSRDRARDDVHPGRPHDVAALHRRVDRRARRRLRLRHAF